MTYQMGDRTEQVTQSRMTGFRRGAQDWFAGRSLTLCCWAVVLACGVAGAVLSARTATVVIATRDLGPYGLVGMTDVRVERAAFASGDNIDDTVDAVGMLTARSYRAGESLTGQGLVPLPNLVSGSTPVPDLAIVRVAADLVVSPVAVNDRVAVFALSPQGGYTPVTQDGVALSVEGSTFTLALPQGDIRRVLDAVTGNQLVLVRQAN